MKCPINCIECPILEENRVLKKKMIWNVVKTVLAILVIAVIIWLVTGCSITKCGPCWHLRLGKQEIEYIHGLSEPNRLEFEMRKQKGGENIKPNLPELIGLVE